MTDLTDDCAHEIMEITPQIMQSIRIEMRNRHGSDISIPQFRALRFIQKNPEASLSMLAEHLGLMLPSVSKLVDGLVKAGLVSRQESAADRRCMTLRLTTPGELIVNAARVNAREHLAKNLCVFEASELQTIQAAMLLLHRLFTPLPGAQFNKDQV